MRLLFVTQTLDADDPVLGFVADWVKELAGRFGEVTVIANKVGSVADDLDVRLVSLGAEDGVGRIARGMRYQRVLRDAIRGRGVDAFVAHMCPVYLNLPWPQLRVRGVPTMLWFAHPSVTPIF